MPNTTATSTWVMKETGRRWLNSLKFVANLDRTYDDAYEQAGAKVGDTVKARLPQRFVVSDGAALVQQNLYDRTVPIPLTNQKHVGFGWSSREQTTDLERIRERYIEPAASALANAADALAWTNLYYQGYWSIGTPGGGPPTDTLDYLEAGVKLTDMGAPEGRIAVLDPWQMANIANASSTLFNPGAVIGENYKTGMFGRNQLGVSEWFQDQNAKAHTTGTYTASTPLIKGASQTGSTLATDGWASGASSLKRGDVFTVADVYSVNPVSYESTGRLQQFVVTADTSDVTGEMLTLPISPSIVTSGQLQTVSGSPANNAIITVLGATSATSGTLATTVSKQGVVFVKDAAAFVMADLVQPDAGAKSTSVRSKEMGMSIRMVEQYNILSDQNPSRLDILIGTAMIRPEWFVRIWS